MKGLRINKALFSTTLFALLLCCGAGLRAQTYFLTPFAGDPVQLKLIVSQLTATSVKFELEVVPSPNIGDIRGFFFNVSDDSFLAGLTITGADITQIVKSAGAVSNLGGGNNIHPTGAFDVGIEFGTPGIGTDDIQSTSFTVSHSNNLAASLFTSELNANGEFLFAARLTSVGLPGGSREGSSKVGTNAPVPEPAFYQMAALLGFGGLGALRLRKSRRTRYTSTPQET